jgi:hypothetical protein
VDPLRARRAPLRELADLAPDAARATVIVGAVHHAVDTLAWVGAADLRAVDTAIRAARIYVPTRTLPEYYDVPYRYGNATPAATAALLDTYQAACSATEYAVTGLDTVAVTMNAPTRTLAAARAATRPEPDTGERREAGPLDRPGQRPAASAPQLPADWPGSVEQAVRSAGSPDLILLMRARAIDKLAGKLIGEAKEPSQNVAARGLGCGHGRTGPLARNPARIAGENFPLGPRVAPTTGRGTGPPLRSAGAPSHPRSEDRRRHR